MVDRIEPAPEDARLSLPPIELIEAPVTRLATASVVCAVAWPVFLVLMLGAVYALDWEQLFHLCGWALFFLPPAGLILGVSAFFRVRFGTDIIGGNYRALFGTLANGFWLLVCLLGHKLSGYGIFL